MGSFSLRIAAVALILVPATAGALALTNVVSRKVHGAAGTFDLPIDTAQNIGTSPTTDSRAIGTGHVVVFQFDGPVSTPGPFVVADESGVAVGGATALAVGNEVRVTIPGVADNKRFSISLSDVNGAGVAVSAAAGFLIGDADSSRSVTAPDVDAIKARSGQAAGAANFRFDVNASGAVTASDILLAKGRLGTVLPPALTVGGTVAGLAGTLKLENNGGDTITISGNGSFTFPQAVATGNPYAVTVLAQPVNATCVIAGGSGTMGAASVTSVAVNCADPSSEGTLFHLALPDHVCLTQVSQIGICGDTPVVRLRIVSRVATSGEVYFNGSTYPFTIAAGGEAIVALPTTAVLVGDETVESKAIRVSAQDPVGVYAIVQSYAASDGFLALPDAFAGTDYYVIARSGGGLPGSSFAIAAGQDGTTVTITPAAAGLTHPAGVAFQVNLDSGQTYLFENDALADVTLSRVTSDKPVTVFGGVTCAAVLAGDSFCDYLVEQIPDISRLGKKHHVTPWRGRASQVVRIVGTVNGTTLTYNPAVAGAPAVIAAGAFAEFTATGAFEVVSSAPVLVAHYMRGSSNDPVPTGGDPSMALVTPSEQGIALATFPVNDLDGPGAASSLSVVIATSAVSSLALDGAPLSATFTAIGTSGFSVAAFAIATGPHTLSASSPFTGTVYGYGSPSDPTYTTSYSYPLPRTLKVLPP